MNRVRDFREKAKLTQQQLAEQTGLSLSTIRAIETGRWQPRLTSAQSIALVLKTKVELLFGVGEGVAS